VLAAVKDAAREWPEGRAILDGRCARRHLERAGRDGRMVPIEQKDGTEEGRASKPGQITHSIPRRGKQLLSMTALYGFSHSRTVQK